MLPGMAAAADAGDEESGELSRIYEAYHGKVLAYAAKLLGRSEADDIAQEVFLKVGRSLGGLEDRSKLASWIYAITLNTVRDAVRRRSVRPEGAAGTSADAVAAAGDEQSSPLARLPDTSARTPEEAVARNEMIACYLDYVRKLPRNYYEVYVLSELGELPDEAIARRLSLSVGTVKIRLHRARAKLHEQLRRNCRCYRNARGDLMGEPND
jgi:RNA polymerase sigma-70 factor (ECF subfamily)